MNKIALGLIMALGLSNVSAMDNNAELTQAVEQSNAPVAAKKGALALMKNPLVIAAAAAVVYGIVSGAAHRFAQQAPNGNAVDERNFAIKGLTVVDSYANKTVNIPVLTFIQKYGYTVPADYVGNGYSVTKNFVTKNKGYTAAGVAGFALLVAAIYDLTLAKESYIKSLMSKKPASQSQDVAATTEVQ